MHHASCIMHHASCVMQHTLCNMHHTACKIWERLADSNKRLAADVDALPLHDEKLSACVQHGCCCNDAVWTGTTYGRAGSSSLHHCSMQTASLSRLARWAKANKQSKHKRDLKTKTYGTSSITSELRHAFAHTHTCTHTGVSMHARMHTGAHTSSWLPVLPPLDTCT